MASKVGSEGVMVTGVTSNTEESITSGVISKKAVLRTSGEASISYGTDSKIGIVLMSDDTTSTVVLESEAGTESKLGGKISSGTVSTTENSMTSGQASGLDPTDEVSTTGE